jgi:hypothetical protein
MLPVQVSRIASEERQSNGIPSWRSETRARIREQGSNETPLDVNIDVGA